MTIAVVYQAWLPAGQEPIDRFMKSYWSHRAGTAHDLVVCPKQVGTDIGCYFDAASNLKHDYLCFLNAYSEILTTDWLVRLHRELTPGVGIVGATGSWETMDFLGWPEFPNPHIRSTGFMLKRDTFQRYLTIRPEEKEDCYAFESGPESITNFIRMAGMEALVVGRTGPTVWSDWYKSRTFRSNQQERLLIADNKTKEYDFATNVRRAELRISAWGNHALQDM